MTIVTHKGDLFEGVTEQSNAIIMHGCNAQGVMGAGFAKTLREKYPRAYNLYRLAHEEQGLKLGTVTFHFEKSLVIANAITQEYYGRRKDIVYVNYLAIEQCCKYVAYVALALRMPVHFPMIGAGLANGDWDVIKDLIDTHIPDPIEKHLWVL